MDENNKELDSFLSNAMGISRITLNILCLVGLFTMGILLVWTFHRLKKLSVGFAYWLTYTVISITIFVKRFGDFNPEQQDISMLKLMGLIGLVIYIIGWVHANSILTKYMKYGEDRLNQIDELPEDKLTIDIFIEKGLIQLKVFTNNDVAFEEFNRALQFSGGKSSFVSSVGDLLLSYKQYNLAKLYYDRALTNAENDKLIKHITKGLSTAERKLK